MKCKEAIALIKTARDVYAAVKLWDDSVGCDPVYIKVVKAEVLTHLRWFTAEDAETNVRLGLDGETVYIN